jgi:hypothetical protein
MNIGKFPHFLSERVPEIQTRSLWEAHSSLEPIFKVSNSLLSSQTTLNHKRSDNITSDEMSYSWDIQKPTHEDDLITGDLPTVLITHHTHHG